MDTIETIERISTDFNEGKPPFDDVQFPEERLLDELPHDTKEDRLRLVSTFAMSDYNRNANQLVDNLIELHERSPRYFYPSYVSTEEQLQDPFEDIGFRYPSRDAAGWYENFSILLNKYNGLWSNLLLDVGCDAPRLVERLRDDDFKYIKGDKIAPMYARIIDDDVAPLSNVWDLEIPVDTHTRRLSKDLFDAPDLSDDAIRNMWRDLAVMADIDRSVVDGAIWHIGNKWDEWGKDYWEKATSN